MLKDRLRMNRTIKIVLTILTVSLMTGCDLMKNAFTYKDKTKEFVETLLKEDYDKCIDLFALEHENAKNFNIDTMKIGLATFRKLIVNNWGTELEYTFIKTEKKFSTIESENTPSNATYVLMEFNNQKEFGVLKVLFDDNSKKILNIKTLDIKAPIPTMTYFWLFGLLAICIPIFNIYVIRQINRSDLKKKWLKYITVILLNTPAISYAAVNGLSFKLLNIQMLFGLGFGYSGFLNSHWTFGIPLGGLYWFWKIRQQKNLTTNNEITTNQNIDIEPATDDEKPMTE